MIKLQIEDFLLPGETKLVTFGDFIATVRRVIRKSDGNNEEFADIPMNTFLLLNLEQGSLQYG